MRHKETDTKRYNESLTKHKVILGNNEISTYQLLDWENTYIKS